MRKRARGVELGVALAAALALGGCGSGNERAAPPPPRLPAPLAAAKALQTRTIAAINAGRVPARLQEPLSGAANDLIERINCAPPPSEENHKGKDKKHGKGKHGQDGDEG